MHLTSWADDVFEMSEYFDACDARFCSCKASPLIRCDAICIERVGALSDLL